MHWGAWKIITERRIVMDKEITPPKKDGGDLVHAGGKGLLGAIPFAGTAAIEVFNSIVKPPYEKRVDSWRADIGEAVSELAKEKGLNIEELNSNDAFIDIITQATQAAIKTSKLEKREALKNAVLNAAIDESPDESLNHMFIRFVDEFTVWHLKAIQLVYAPEIVLKQTGKDVKDIRTYMFIEMMLHVYPELKKKEGFIEQVINDLHNKGLMLAKFEGVTYFGNDTFENLRKELGRKFYEFITFNED